MRRVWIVLVTLACATPGVRAEAEDAVRVFAAASLTVALQDVANRWSSAGHPPPVLSFGASAALARQVAAGAPADMFATADPTWMDWLDGQGKVERASRGEWLGNTLVLVAPKGRGFPVRLERGFAFGEAFRGRLCMGEPGVVPAGTYGQEALQSLGFWDSVASRVVGTDDVRAALAFVERGECGAAIVYATDAVASRRVERVATFPAGSHRPIRYSFALVPGARPEARAFLDALRTSPEARATFVRLGFDVRPAP